LKDKSDNIEEKIKYDYLIRKLFRYRNKKIKIWFHLISTRIVEYALLSKAKHIIISRDILESKNGINLGKTTNQNFVSIPFALLIDMIKYKAKKYGIEVSDKEKEYFKSKKLFNVLKKKLCRPTKFNIYQLQNANLFLHRLLSMPAGISNNCSGLNAGIYKFLYIF